MTASQANLAIDVLNLVKLFDQVVIWDQKRHWPGIPIVYFKNITKKKYWIVIFWLFFCSHVTIQQINFNHLLEKLRAIFRSSEHWIHCKCTIFNEQTSTLLHADCSTILTEIHQEISVLNYCYWHVVCVIEVDCSTVSVWNQFIVVFLYPKLRELVTIRKNQSTSIKYWSRIFCNHKLVNVVREGKLLNFISSDSKRAASHAKVVLKNIAFNKMAHFFWHIIPNKVEVENSHILCLF